MNYYATHTGFLWYVKLTVQIQRNFLKREAHGLKKHFFLQKVDTVLRSNPKGEEIFKEYDETKTLSDATCRQVINIPVAEMTESYG